MVSGKFTTNIFLPIPHTYVINRSGNIVVNPSSLSRKEAGGDAAKLIDRPLPLMVADLRFKKCLLRASLLHCPSARRAEEPDLLESEETIYGRSVLALLRRGTAMLWRISVKRR